MNSEIERVDQPTKSDLQEIFDKLSHNQWKVRRTDASQRIQKLQQLEASIRSHEQQILESLNADLRQGELGRIQLEMCYADIGHTIENLHNWMKPVDVETYLGAPNQTAKIIYEARGIVLLFGPWNVPFALLIQPLITAVAAGNCVIAKPNEMTPKTSRVISRVITDAFDSNEVAVVEGDVKLANHLLEFPVDHIFFTGSPAVGKVIMAAAAKNLTSVTLELGGKNPVIIDSKANIQDAATKIAAVRNANNGQVCLCPENVWIHEDLKSEFISAAAAAFQNMFYSDGELSLEASGKIVDERNLERVKSYIEDATDRGAKLAFGGAIVEDERCVHPTILTDIPHHAKINKEEVFGPILSVFTYQNMEEVYQSLHKDSKPLALYIFSNDHDFIANILENTTSGGVTINDCMTHYLEKNLPFGGVNGSGIGRYHGVHGFKELSHERSVFRAE